MAPLVPLDHSSASPRRDFECEPVDASDIGDVERPLTLIEQTDQQRLRVRRFAILVALGLIWELYARWIDNPLILPTLGATLATFFTDLGERRAGRSRCDVAAVSRARLCGRAGHWRPCFTTIAVSTRVGSDLLSTLTAMFNPVPAIALLPLALIWFGLGTPSLVFVIVHSVLWAVALNTLTGFSSVPETLRMSGRNCGLHGVNYVALILIPAAFPSILSRPEDRLGVRLAHADCRRACVRCVVPLRRAWLVHFRGASRARDRSGLCRIAGRHPDRTDRRSRHLPVHRKADGAALGHATLERAEYPTRSIRQKFQTKGMVRMRTLIKGTMDRRQ